MFQELFNLMQDAQMLTITLMRKDEQLIVCLLPTSKGNLGSDLSPLSITATPMELDANFIEVIQTPLQKRCEVLSNLEEFQKDTQKAVEKTKKSTTEITKSVPVGQVSKSSKQVEEAEKLESAGNLPAAYGMYKKIYEQDKTNTKIGEKMQEVWAKMSKQTLFKEEQKVEVEEEEEEEVFEIIPAPIIEVKQEVIAEEIVKEDTSKTDMFQLLVDESKNKSLESVQMPQPNFDSEQWRQFQEFQKMQQQQQTAEV